MMPMVLKIISGSGKSVIQDFLNVPTEGEWFSIHWKELIAVVLANGNPAAFEFFWEFGKYLRSIGNISGSEICSMLTGAPLTPPGSGDGFSYVGTFSSSYMYSELYEYILQLNSAATPLITNGFPHLLPLKFRHAEVLADYGAFVEAQKYCNFIGQTLKNIGKTQYFTSDAFTEFQRLLVRISDAESSESGWFGSKISKVNLDKMWGHLDKFIGGEEPSKLANSGVFSKFSPSVSRVGSVLDFTASSQYQSLPHIRSDANMKDPIQGSSAGLEGPPSGNDIFNGNRQFANSRYSPSMGQGVPRQNQQPVRTPMSENMDANSLFGNFSPGAAPPHPGSVNLSGSVYPNSRYAPSNASSLNLVNNNQPQSVPPSLSANVPPAAVPPPLNRAPSKYAPPGVNVQTAQNPPNVQKPSTKTPYQNINAAVSNLSLGSQHVSQPAVAPPPTGSSKPLSSTDPAAQYSKRGSISSVLSTDNFINPDNIRNHNHSPSIQSEISLDYPPEFKADRRDSDVINHDSKKPPQIPSSLPEQQFKEDNKEDVEGQSLGNSKSQTTLAPPASAEFNPAIKEQELLSTVGGNQHETNQGSELDETPTKPASTPGPPPLGNNSSSGPSSTGPPPPGGVRAPARRANPYAPGGTSRKATSNKYGPPSGANSYAPGSSNALNPPQTDLTHPSGNTETGAAQSIQKPEAAPDSMPNHQRPQPPRELLFRPTNIDESFDADEDPRLATPKPKGVLTLNDKSPKNQDSVFSPYQAESLRRPSAFGIDSTFNEFPIPGSPDLTTRANSVIGGVGGGGGLFSSRLSQSQQSAMYQQYEVQDDTVADYIPSVEEDDEDSDEEEQSKKRKREEEKKKQDKIKQAQTRGSQGQQGPGTPSRRWLSWLNRNNEDGPKPIRAKLGEQNKFVYSQEHKRWINTEIPIEEQLKSNAPPPPPKMKRDITPARPPGGPVGPVPDRGRPLMMESSDVDKKPLNISSPPPGLGPGGGSNDVVTSTPENNDKNKAMDPMGSSSQPNNSGPPRPPSNTGGSGGPPKPASLANAGLDDLLSLGGGSNASVASGRKGKRGGRRGYVNVLDQK